MRVQGGEEKRREEKENEITTSTQGAEKGLGTSLLLDSKQLSNTIPRPLKVERSSTSRKQTHFVQFNNKHGRCLSLEIDHVNPWDHFHLVFP